MDKIVLKEAPRGMLRFGHPWVYKNQIHAVSGSPAPGDVISVESKKGRFLGIGYFNPQSEISVRLLSRELHVIDKNFILAKVKKALDFRKQVVRETNAYRVVSSEADGLPGLIVDLYDEVLVVQFLTLGMERLKPLVIEALGELIPSRGIYERSDSSSRSLEGLEARTGWIRKDCGDEVTVFEKDVRFSVALGEGHKTGLYLDQRENRLFSRDWVSGGEVLDAFCYEGAFGLHLAKSGNQVLGMDTQKEAILRAESHRKLNGISEERLRFKAGNVFEELKALEKEKRKFDLVILDPPSFVKKKEALEGALSGYKEILLRAMKLLKEGGRLAVFSCSYVIDDTLLMQVSLSAAMDVKKDLRVLKFLKQSGDHPIHPFIPETYYLKGFLFQVASI